MGTVTFSATPWRTSSSQGPVQAQPIRSIGGNTRTYTFGGSGSVGGGGLIGGSRGTSSMSRPTTAAGGSSSSSSSSSADLMRTAKELAQMQMDGDMKKMQAAFGYRTQEADQQQRFRGVNAHQDSDLKMREADQAFGFSTRRADQDSGLRMREADQSHLHRSREGEQQFNFSRTLQRDNNDVREKMQQAGFTQDRDMTNLRDRLEGERTQRQALRASQSFRGRF